MLNKLIKVWILVVVLGVGYTVVFSDSDETPKFVIDAKTDLFLAYRENIYDTVKCDIKNSNDSWVVFCHPNGDVTGGVYQVDAYNDGNIERYKLYAINGKAQTHADKLGLVAKVKHDSNVDLSKVTQ